MIGRLYRNEIRLVNEIVSVVDTFGVAFTTGVELNIGIPLSNPRPSRHSATPFAASQQNAWRGVPPLCYGSVTHTVCGHRAGRFEGFAV